MRQCLRKTLFSIYVLFFRFPVWVAIWLLGRTGLIKTLFVIYPTDKKEYSDLCPDIQFIVNYLSGRPTPGGIIFDGWKPVGIYLFISNPPQELIKKKNRHIADSIIRHMHWALKISGAKACGFAGQLGPILEKRHGIPMEPPFFSSTMGNIFSIDDSISFLAKQAKKNPWQLSISILGGGDLGEMLREHFVSQGYGTDIVKMTFKRRSGVEVTNIFDAGQQLDRADFVINLLPKGEDFLNSGVPELLASNSTIIDFSRPAINKEELKNKIFMGNRVQRAGMRFAFSLPGDWQQKELPACSMPSILASNFGVVEQNITKFCTAARQYAFETALASAIQPIPVPLFTRLQNAGANILTECVYYLRNAREQFIL